MPCVFSHSSRHHAKPSHPMSTHLCASQHLSKYLETPPVSLPPTGTDACLCSHVQGLALNAGGLSRIVTSCSQLGQCEEAYAGWTMMQAAGLVPDMDCLNALLAALHGAKQWQHAVHVFQASRQAQVCHLICFVALLCCCLPHAYSRNQAPW